MHSPVREQTNIAYQYVYWSNGMKAWKGICCVVFLVDVSLRKSVSIFKVLTAVGWDRRDFQVP